MVGVFYAAPSPWRPSPIVTVGSKVKKGDVLCIIEAMKLMNEITAEEDGEIVDICAAQRQRRGIRPDRSSSSCDLARGAL